MPCPTSPYYRRNRLDADAQARYDLVIDAVREHAERLPSGAHPEDWTAVADHPELFWMAGPLMDDGSGAWKIQYYDLSPQEIAREQRRIDRTAEMILDLAPAGGSDWDKALYVYEALVRLVRYEEDAAGIALAGSDASGVWRNGRDFSRTIYGPLAEHWGVCVGYAMAMQYLLQLLGIECLHVQGKSAERGGGHAWNIACLDGEYCLIDATFGRGWSVGADDRPVYVAHDWFGFSPDDYAGGAYSYYETPPTIPLPARFSTACDWFRRTGWFVEEFNPAQVDALVERARAERLTVLEVKCASDAACDAVRRHLEGQHGLVVFPHRLHVLAAPLLSGVQLVGIGPDGEVVVP